MSGLTGRSRPVGQPAKPDAGSAWMPLVPISDHAWLGTVGQSWWIGTSFEARRAVDLDHPVGLLPLLERDPNDALAILAESGRAGLPTIEPRAILRAAGEMPSDYWMSLALGWMEGGPALLEDRELLREVGESTRSQAIRHRARQLLRRSGPDGVDDSPRVT